VDWQPSVAVRSSSDVEPRADWGRRLAGAGLIALGIAGVGTAGAVYLDAWSTSEAWIASPEAQALARQAAEPTPIWLPVWLPPGTPGPLRVGIEPLPTPNALSRSLAPTPVPTVTVAAEDLSVDAIDFRFLDPPEPGAHARIALSVTNHGAATSNRILLGIPSKWFDSYSVIGTGPAVLEDRVDEDGLRTFSFPHISAAATASFELHVTAVGEGTLAPSVKVLLANGDLVHEVQKLPTLAPPPRPGPVMSIDIPRLKLKSGVVQTAWEPPPFTVGQIKGTANISEGNTVLIGHLSGAAGNVFARLDELKPGDEITAISRGLPYSFVVSRTFEAKNDDKEPMLQADESRLTLMTCAGLFNPFTHDYPERLWVVAEAPEQAAATIATAAATATAEAIATGTAVALLPTATPTPTPFAGEPSLPGGIGNTRVNLEKAFGKATGETSGKLVVFRQPGRQVHVAFTPDPPRAAHVALVPANALPFEAAVRESRKLFPNDATPRIAAPEGNPSIIVERFASLTLAALLDTGDFSVIYTRDARGLISSIVLGPGDDIDALIEHSRR
jgi:LPXTG-site transpeptidase (sortase) family protein